MRLLQIHESGTFSLVEKFGDDIPPYAILSHTWGTPDEEVSFRDMQTGSGENKRGYRKLLFCGKQAADDGLRYFWVDTCCIDKTSSAELSEAINSMYMWYGAAEVCYAYLADVPSNRTFQNSRWFERGWTLQELIAPMEVIFFDEKWEPLGTRLELSKSVQGCTGIPERVFLESTSLDSFSVAQKMSWAANRGTTRVEDRAYCLMGIFGINMPLIYGEGENSFIRLQEEVMRISDDHSLFAWSSQDGRGGCLATTPLSFRDCANVVQTNHLDTLYDPPVLSSRGVQIELRFMGCGPGRRGLAILNCCEQGSADKPFAIYVQDLSRSLMQIERICRDTLTIPVRNIDPSRYSVRKLHIRTGRPNGQKADQRIFDRLSSQEWQGGSTFWTRIDTPQALFKALDLATEVDVWLLLTRPGVRINMKDISGQTALSYASSKGYEGAVRMLLAQRDIEVNLTNNLGQTPLLCAAKAGMTATVNLLLDDLRTERSKKDTERRTPLSWAAAHGRSAVVELLLHADNTQVSMEDVNKRTPLSWAAAHGRSAVVELLLHADNTQVSMGDINKRTPLSWAAAHGHSAVVELLLHADNTQVSMGDVNNRTPLSWAAAHGYSAVVELLLHADKT
ncbi:hypothetical protein B5807_06712 [Epicoccum nigrum]|uniref:Heterokaryon incompatibility domain-containing protein n=1 Tax=Epicoccum nigrum TaxID=105696 RepID=A0A1Y2LVT0_EPING|nr:hypothetical protein B5807_06712 [Epicoccum nigrum]